MSPLKLKSFLEKTFAIQKQLAGDASSRCYWRLKNKKGLVCYDPSPDSFKDFQIIQHYLSENHIPVPKIYKVFHEESIMHLEDLGDQTLLLENSLATREQEFSLYQKAIDIIIRMQKLEYDKIPSTVKNRFFDTEKYHQELEISSYYFLKKFLRISKDKIKRIESDFSKVISEVIHQDHYFTHRDYHSRNIMLSPTGKAFSLIDFQDARMGQGIYDLVSLLEDCYIDIHRENKKNLLLYYWKEHGEKALSFKSFHDFQNAYQYMKLQRVFKAIGSFSYIFEKRKDIRYVKYIGFSMEKIREGLQELQQTPPLAQDLIRAYYES